MNLETILETARAERAAYEAAYQKRERETAVALAQTVKRTLGQTLWAAITASVKPQYESEETIIPFAAGSINAVHWGDDGRLQFVYYVNGQKTNVRTVLHTHPVDEETTDSNAERFREFLLKATEWKPEDDVDPFQKPAPEKQIAGRIDEQWNVLQYIRRNHELGAEAEAAIAQAKATLLVAEALLLIEARLGEAGK